MIVTEEIINFIDIKKTFACELGASMREILQI